MQDIPPTPIQFIKEGEVPIEGIQQLVYAKPDLTQVEPLVEDFEVNDVRATDEFLVWWQVETEGDVREEVGHQVHQ